MTRSHRIFWPYVLSAPLFAVCSGVLIESSSWPIPPEPSLSVVFAVTLLVAASARAGGGERLSEAASLVLCLVPFGASLLLGADVQPTSVRAIALMEVTRLHATGAHFSLGLVAAELMTWCRFPNSRRRSIFAGLLVALPLQLQWAHQWFSDAIEVAAHASFGLASLVLILLAVVRGARPMALLSGLVICSALTAFVRDAQLAMLAFHQYGCTPATDLEIFAFEFAGKETFELLFWVPGAISLVLGLLVLRTKVPIALISVAGALTALHFVAPAQFDGFSDETREYEQRDFILRGRGELADVLRISAETVLDVDSAKVLSTPLKRPGALGQLLARRAWPSHVCGDTELKVAEVALDARLTPSQDLVVARAARDAGIDVLRVYEGEDRSEPGSRFLLSSHLRRFLANSNSVYIVLRDEQSACSAKATTTNLRAGRGWTEVLRLEFPASN